MVVVETESFGNYQSGKLCNNKYAQVFDILDGKIYAVREYPYTQLGADMMTKWEYNARFSTTLLHYFFESAEYSSIKL
jgi:hypothetical protein